MKYALFLALLATSITCFGQSDTIRATIPDYRKIEEPQKSLQEIVRTNRINKNNLLIYIDKSDYTLQVKHKDSVLVTYPVVFGFNPVDDKKEEGDGCTPEGDFIIRSRYAHSSWTYFIWIDYPNKESWKRFNQRKEADMLTEGATIGGEIGIHAVPDGMDDLVTNRTNWTLGCISLTTADMIDLYKSIGSNTMIRIVP